MALSHVSPFSFPSLSKDLAFQNKMLKYPNKILVKTLECKTTLKNSRPLIAFGWLFIICLWLEEFYKTSLVVGVLFLTVNIMRGKKTWNCIFLKDSILVTDYKQENLLFYIDVQDIQDIQLVNGFFFKYVLYFVQTDCIFLRFHKTDILGQKRVVERLLIIPKFTNQLSYSVNQTTVNKDEYEKLVQWIKQVKRNKTTFI